VFGYHQDEFEIAGSQKSEVRSREIEAGSLELGERSLKIQSFGCYYRFM